MIRDCRRRLFTGFLSFPPAPPTLKTLRRFSNDVSRLAMVCFVLPLSPTFSVVSSSSFSFLSSRLHHFDLFDDPFRSGRTNDSPINLLLAGNRESLA